MPLVKFQLKKYSISENYYCTWIVGMVHRRETETFVRTNSNKMDGKETSVDNKKKFVHVIVLEYGEIIRHLFYSIASIVFYNIFVHRLFRIYDFDHPICFFFHFFFFLVSMHSRFCFMETAPFPFKSNAEKKTKRKCHHLKLYAY